jgi:hypothetical protein
MIVYHTTNYDSLIKILESKVLVTEYFSVRGLYVGRSAWETRLFGVYTLTIEVDENNLTEDDVNDGLFHKGEIKLDQVIGVQVLKENEQLLFKDLVNVLLRKYNSD